MQLQSEITPKGFSLTREEAAVSTLLIHFGLGDTSFCIVDANSQVKMIGEVSYGVQDAMGVEKLIADFAILTFQFEEVKVSFDTFKFTFIPLIHYNSAFLNEYGRFVNPEEQESIALNRIPTAAVANVFAINTDFQQALLEKFQHPRVFTQVSPFLNGARRISQANAIYNVFVNIKSSAFEIGVIREEGLQFYNIFPFTSPEEFNYYLLLVIQQFQLTSENTILTISGRITENDMLFLVLKKYFMRILSAPTEVVFNLASGLRALQSPAHYSLLSLQLCD